MDYTLNNMLDSKDNLVEYKSLLEESKDNKES
jgi:hypothetical protein